MGVRVTNLAGLSFESAERIEGVGDSAQWKLFGRTRSEIVSSEGFAQHVCSESLSVGKIEGLCGGQFLEIDPDEYRATGIEENGDFAHAARRETALDLRPGVPVSPEKILATAPRWRAFGGPKAISDVPGTLSAKLGYVGDIDPHARTMLPTTAACIVQAGVCDVDFLASLCQAFSGHTPLLLVGRTSGVWSITALVDAPSTYQDEYLDANLVDFCDIKARRYAKVPDSAAAVFESTTQDVNRWHDIWNERSQHRVPFSAKLGGQLHVVFSRSDRVFPAAGIIRTRLFAITQGRASDFRSRADIRPAFLYGSVKAHDADSWFLKCTLDGFENGANEISILLTTSQGGPDQCAGAHFVPDPGNQVRIFHSGDVHRHAELDHAVRPVSGSTDQVRKLGMVGFVHPSTSFFVMAEAVRLCSSTRTLKIIDTVDVE